MLLCTADEDVALLKASASSGSAAEWIVPKRAFPGDDVMFFVWGSGILAMGRIQSAPKLQTQGQEAKRYRAKVSDLSLLDPPISMGKLSEALPSWAWLRYPRMYTMPSGEITDVLRNLAVSPTVSLDVDLIEAQEGKARLVQHLVAERNPRLVAQKKQLVLETEGCLACEVCGFDFKEHYGERGTGFCEVHHLEPIGTRIENTTTRSEDLVILCSNCHRIIHRGGLITPQELRALLTNETNDGAQPTAPPHRGPVG